jgi:transcriptional regulator with XRE-family HTH domain
VSGIEELFGLVIRRRRERLGLSQEVFAEKAGVHRTYISSIELGKVQVSIGVAQRLADALGVRLSVLWRDIEQERDSRSSS